MVLLVSAFVAFRPGVGRETVALLLAADVAAALVFSKVLSPQYFLFLLPVLLVAPWPKRRGLAITYGLLILFIYVLTGIIFPWAYAQVVRLTPAVVALVIARNAALVVAAGSLLYRAWARRSCCTGCSNNTTNATTPKKGDILGHFGTWPAVSRSRT